MPDEDLVCPECGGPIGQTSTFCMHCSADLTDRHPTHSIRNENGSTATDTWIDTDADVVDLEEIRSEKQVAHQQDLPQEFRSASGAVDRTKLLPDDFAIKAVTFLLAIAAGLAVGIGGMYVLSGHLQGWLAFLLGVLCWLGSTVTFLRAVPG